MTTRREFLERTAAGIAAGHFPDLRSAITGPIHALTRRRRRSVVQTVQGPIDAAQLGFTLPHEHLFASSAGFWQAYPGEFGSRGNFLVKVTDHLKKMRDEGVVTLVDVTPIDVGRDIRFIEEASRTSGMQIVACTGHWLDPSSSMKARTSDELAEFFVREIERGIDGTDIKAGIIKVATDREGVTPFLEKALRAAARASKATGVPVTTHSFAALRMGEKQAAIFEAEGLNPKSVCIGHSDDSDDMDYLAGLARRGYTLGMDHLTHGLQPPAQGGAQGGAGPLPWQKRAENVKKLVDSGFADRVFLSNDWFFGISLGGTGAMEALERMNPDRMLFVTRKVIPYLKQIGLADRVVRRLTVENPRRFFGGA